MAIIIKEDKNEVREYLLGRLGEADEEALELRLLTDPAYSEEFDTVVDEITDEYVNNELQGEERDRVEQYFLSSPERQQKLQFASELLRHAEDERGKREEVRQVAPASKPSLVEQFLALWKKPAFAPVLATLVLTIGLFVFINLQRGNSSSANYTPVTLVNSASDRATGSQQKPVPMPENGLTINLPIPEKEKNAKDFQVKLFDPNGVARDLAIEAKDGETIKVAIPASELSRGPYAIQLFSVKAAGTERVPGSYFFTIQ